MPTRAACAIVGTIFIILSRLCLSFVAFLGFQDMPIERFTSSSSSSSLLKLKKMFPFSFVLTCGGSGGGGSWSGGGGAGGLAEAAETYIRSTETYILKCCARRCCRCHSLARHLWNFSEKTNQRIINCCRLSFSIFILA